MGAYYQAEINEFVKSEKSAIVGKLNSNSREKVKQAELVICHSIKYASILRVNLLSSQE
jgi:hypothetical protein